MVLSSFPTLPPFREASVKHDFRSEFTGISADDGCLWTCRKRQFIPEMADIFRLPKFGLSGLFASGLNPTAQFVGSYGWSMSLSRGNLNITLTNATAMYSAFYHAPGFHPDPPTPGESVFGPPVNLVTQLTRHDPHARAERTPYGYLPFEQSPAVLFCWCLRVPVFANLFAPGHSLCRA